MERRSNPESLDYILDCFAPLAMTFDVGMRGLVRVLAIANEDFVMDPSGALFWPREGLLAVADLHFEKGSSYAARRVFLPPYDTATTLAVLSEVVARYQPRCIVALGDSFHDALGSARLLPQDQASLRDLQKARNWIWISGNHDPYAPLGLGGDVMDELKIGPIRFRHAPEAEAEAGEIAGHLHPMARIGGLGRRRCFVSDGQRCILPAFGAFTGGLNLRDQAFDMLFRRMNPFAHVLGRDRVYRVPHRYCLAD